MNCPICIVWLLLRYLTFCPVIDKVHQSLRFHSRPGHIFQIERSKLNCPLGNPASGFSVLNDISQRSRADHCNWMPEEIMLQLAIDHEYSKHQLLPMWVSLLGFRQDLTDIINRPLNWVLFTRLLALHHNCSTDSSVVSRHIQKQRLLFHRCSQNGRSTNCLLSASNASLAASLQMKSSIFFII